MFWSYLALGVTLQLLSLLSLARRLKRTVKRRRRKGRQRRRWRAGQEKDERTREGGRGDDEGWRVTNENGRWKKCWVRCKRKAKGGREKVVRLKKSWRKVGLAL